MGILNRQNAELGSLEYSYENTLKFTYHSLSTAFIYSNNLLY